jgi:hypothetical protein
MWALAESVGRYFVKVVSLLSGVSGLGCVLIRRQLSSLLRFSVLVDLERLASDFVTLRPAATDAHDRVDGSDAE